MPDHRSESAPRWPWPPHPPMLQIWPSLTPSTSATGQGQGCGSIHLPTYTTFGVHVHVSQARVLVRSGGDPKEEEEIHDRGYIQRPRHHPPYHRTRSPQPLPPQSKLVCSIKEEYEKEINDTRALELMYTDGAEILDKTRRMRH